MQWIFTRQHGERGESFLFLSFGSSHFNIIHLQTLEFINRIGERGDIESLKGVWFCGVFNKKNHSKTLALSLTLQISLSKADLDQIKTSQDGTLADVVSLNIGNLGENMSLRRGVFLRAGENNILSSYVHPSGKALSVFLSSRLYKWKSDDTRRRTRLVQFTVTNLKVTPTKATPDGWVFLIKTEEWKWLWNILGKPTMLLTMSVFTPVSLHGSIFKLSFCVHAPFFPPGVFKCYCHRIKCNLVDTESMRQTKIARWLIVSRAWNLLFVISDCHLIKSQSKMKLTILLWYPKADNYEQQKF